MTQQATRIEVETCSRCYGSGRYSYNSIDGDRCYGCGGKGVRYTKRGAAAARFLDALRKVPASEIKVGDLIEVDTIHRRYFARVTEVTPQPNAWRSRSGTDAEWRDIHGVKFVVQSKSGEQTHYIVAASAKVRKGFTAEEKQAQLQQALDYQATLTKAGKPRAVRA
jgi:hypothetical protein